MTDYAVLLGVLAAWTLAILLLAVGTSRVFEARWPASRFDIGPMNDTREGTKCDLPAAFRIRAKALRAASSMPPSLSGASLPREVVSPLLVEASTTELLDDLKLEVGGVDIGSFAKFVRKVARRAPPRIEANLTESHGRLSMYVTVRDGRNQNDYLIERVRPSGALLDTALLY